MGDIIVPGRVPIVTELSQIPFSVEKKQGIHLIKIINNTYLKYNSNGDCKSRNLF